jgi:protein tyrosine/serine phosphatase
MALFLMMSVLPYIYYRASYSHAKRLRPIVAGHVYRSGSMTAAGLREAIQKYRIKTVINLQEEAPDPELPSSYFRAQPYQRESELCSSLGAKLEFLFVELVPAERVGKERPATIDRFLKIMDNPNSYPVLLHCKAGLHRTGVLAAVYRMEYQDWTPLEAWHELRSHGFGEFVSDASNDYISQYVLSYVAGIRGQGSGVRNQARQVDIKAVAIPVSSSLTSDP